MITRIPFLFIALILSALNNLLVPYVIYIKKFGLFKKRPKGFVGCNAWGIIMDGFLAGFINITVLNFLLEIKPEIVPEDIKTAFLLGFSSMIAAHIFMAQRAWKIWIMPKPWHFNLAGYWHMVSMTLQMSFLAYPLLLILKNPALLHQSITVYSLIIVFLLAFLFILSFHLGNHGVKIGKLHLSNRPW